MYHFLHGLLENILGSKDRDLPILHSLLHDRKNYTLTQYQQFLCRAFPNSSPLPMVLGFGVVTSCALGSVLDEALFGWICFSLLTFSSWKMGLMKRGWYTPSFAKKKDFYHLLGDFLAKNPSLAPYFSDSIVDLEQGKLSQKWLEEVGLVMSKLRAYKNMSFEKASQQHEFVEIVRKDAWDEYEKSQQEFSSSTQKWKI